MLTEDKVRKAVRKYLGRNHDFCGEILHDDYSERLRFVNYAGPAMEEAGFDLQDVDETEDENGDNMWVSAMDEVERAFLIWLIKDRFSKDEIRKIFRIK